MEASLMFAPRHAITCAIFFLSPLDPVQAENRVPNVPPEGFVALFNGYNLEGWRGQVGDPATVSSMPADDLMTAQQRADQSMLEHWRVMDGVLTFDGKGENLCTTSDYQNFELYVDWKIDSEGDSGIYLRGTPQVQIWDPFVGPRDRVGSGGLFNNRRHADEPLVRADRPIGQWNTFYIMMMGERVSVKLNDKLVVDDTEFENYWDRQRPVNREGPIELQSHGSPIFFRNIFLRELPPHPSPPWESLFDGTNLDRWDFQRFGWRVEDEALTVSRRRRNRDGDTSIWTKDRFGDFILHLDFMMAPECDSGIYIRTNDRLDVQSGFEIQLRDTFGREDLDAQVCGAVLGLAKPTINAVRPANEWNHIRIVAQAELISVVLNDQRVVDLDLNRVSPRPLRDSNSDDPKTPARYSTSDGFIGFQSPDVPVWIRNVRIKRLD